MAEAAVKLAPLGASPSIQLATGVAGAIGCDYRRAGHRLVFVEYGGNVSVIYLVRPLVAIVSSGTTTLQGTYLFNFDTGVEGVSGDVWWEQVDAVVRQMVPQGGATIVNLGTIDYNALSFDVLQGLTYAATPIVGNNDASNQLVPGDVFAVLTNSGNYAKVEVLNYGYDLQIQWETYQLAPMYQVLGSGYSELEDVVVSSDEAHAWLSERGGNLYYIDLTAADRASPSTQVIVSGLTAPQQIVVDETRSLAYVVEYASPGRLIRVDLTTNGITTIVPNLDHPIGIAVTSNGQFAYVTEQTTGPGGGTLSRVRLADGNRQVLLTGMTAPFFLTWGDPGQGGLLATERDPSNKVMAIDLTQSPVAYTPLVTGVAFRPSSVAVVASTQLLVCCNDEVDEYDLTGGVFTAIGDILLGVGNVPTTKIDVGTGLATTDPGYFFQVSSAPFGGTIALMVNHDKAFQMGAGFYTVEVNGVPQAHPFADYLWVVADNQFELQSTSPQNGIFFPVRPLGQLWYNHWLGYFLDTTALGNGMVTIDIRLFQTPDLGTEIGAATDAGRQVNLAVNQVWPRASIDNITHDGLNVDACALVHVTQLDSYFEFVITADHPAGYLLSWSLNAWWGNNQSAVIQSQGYTPPGPWNGITGGTVPAAPGWPAYVAGDDTSLNCAHAFYVGVWDRTINGFNYIHYTEGHRTITLLNP